MSKYKKEFKVLKKDCKDNKLTLKNTMAYMLETSNGQSKELNLLNEDLLQIGLTWMIYKWDIEIISYPREDEEITIYTWANSFKNLIAYREFEIHRGDEIIAYASTEFILVDFLKKKPIRIPLEMVEAYGTVDEKHIDKIKRINPSDKFIKSVDIDVKKEDIDLNNHVNNLVYVDYILDAVEDKKLSIYSLNLIYMKEIKYPNKVSVDVYEEDDGLSFILKTDVDNARALIKYK